MKEEQREEKLQKQQGAVHYPTDSRSFRGLCTCPIGQVIQALIQWVIQLAIPEPRRWRTTTLEDPDVGTLERAGGHAALFRTDASPSSIQPLPPPLLLLALLLLLAPRFPPDGLSMPPRKRPEHLPHFGCLNIKELLPGHPAGPGRHPISKLSTQIVKRLC